MAQQPVQQADRCHPNNIFYSDGRSLYIGLVSGTASPQVSVSNNQYHNNGGAPSFDAAPVVSKPLFVNAAAGDFRLVNVVSTLGALLS